IARHPPWVEIAVDRQQPVQPQSDVGAAGPALVQLDEAPVSGLLLAAERQFPECVQFIDRSGRRQWRRFLERTSGWRLLLRVFPEVAVVAQRRLVGVADAAELVGELFRLPGADQMRVRPANVALGGAGTDAQQLVRILRPER